MPSIRKRSDRKGTRWLADARDVPGGRRTTWKTREEATAALGAMIKAGQQAQPTAADRSITLNDYATRWLEQIAASVDANTLVQYAGQLRRNILPVFGPMKLRELHRGHVRALLAKKRTDGLGKNSVRAIRAALSAMLGWQSEPCLSPGGSSPINAEALSAHLGSVVGFKLTHYRPALGVRAAPFGTGGANPVTTVAQLRNSVRGRRRFFPDSRKR